MYELVKVEYTRNGVEETTLAVSSDRNLLHERVLYPWMWNLPVYPLASTTDYNLRVNHYIIRPTAPQEPANTIVPAASTVPFVAFKWLAAITVIVLIIVAWGG